MLTLRAGPDVTRQVGQLCRSVALVATEYGVGSDTAWSASSITGPPSSRTASVASSLGTFKRLVWTLVRFSVVRFRDCP